MTHTDKNLLMFYASEHKQPALISDTVNVLTNTFFEYFTIHCGLSCHVECSKKAAAPPRRSIHNTVSTVLVLLPAVSCTW